MSGPADVPFDGWQKVAELRLATILLRDEEIRSLATGTMRLTEQIVTAEMSHQHRVDEIAAVKAAANFDISTDRDLETCVRRMYHDLQDAKTKAEAYKKMPALLLEARDALPAITEVSARLNGIRLDLADRIEGALKPWEVKEGGT